MSTSCDNYATHKYPAVQRWLAKRKRFHVHFIPTSASRLSMIERFFWTAKANDILQKVSGARASLVK
jgi:transposase